MNQIVRFTLVGITSTIINFLFYFVCVSFGLSVAISAIIGYLSGLLLSFVLGKNWVFESYKSNSIILLIKFILVYLLGLIMHTFLTHFLELLIDYRISWLIGTLFSALNNFVGSKYLVFKK